MLIHLSVRDIVLIEALDLELDRGMTVLTGETGAGKSILLDALALALGARGDAGLVRSGAKSGQVRAVFELEPDHPSFAILDEAGLEPEGDLIIRRTQSADGRARGYVNDQPVSMTLLRSLGTSLVEIHGQHDDRALVDPASHRQLLDAYGGLQGLVGDVAAAYKAMQAAERERDVHAAALAEAAKEADFLKASVEELTALSPEPGEEEALAARRTHMMQAEKVAADVHEAQEAVSGSASPSPVLAALMRRLERKGPDSEALLGPIIDALGRSLDALGDAGMEIDRALISIEFDPKELNDTEERLFALRAAARKYQVTCDGLPEKAAILAEQLEALDARVDRGAALDQAVKETAARYDGLAHELSAARHRCAEHLSSAVEAELPDLKLVQARFMADVSTNEKERSAHGYDTVAFQVQTNPGTRPGPMMKVASGGELSRFLLALKVVLADKGSAPTLVFDEIDTGAGGAVAEAIGVRLARLAGQVQVLSVTHAPQVAARAHGHLSIAKAIKADQTRTQVERLSEDGRLEELARMLSGAKVTDEARAAAASLLQGERV
ncbi:MAG: DNA repair protein RecN [Hyphomicrobiales bacterium]|jgi:DNA repair protein RecN (Recombination protein N)